MAVYTIRTVAIAVVEGYCGVYGHYRILVKTEISKTSQYEPNAITARKAECLWTCNISKKLYIKNTIDWINFIHSFDTGLYLYHTLLISKDKTTMDFWKKLNAV